MTEKDDHDGHNDYYAENEQARFENSLKTIRNSPKMGYLPAQVLEPRFTDTVANHKTTMAMTMTMTTTMTMTMTMSR